MNYFIYFIIIIIIIILEKSSDIIYHSKHCNCKNLEKRKSNIVWSHGNYIDLGSNNGDSILWFYNLVMPGIKSTVPYPKILLNISKNFNTFIFEANPFLCKKIYSVVDYVKRNSKLKYFRVYCPVIVSTYDGKDILTIAKWNTASSKYYNTNENQNRKNFTLPVINFTKFLQENIPSNTFNVMKFDVEGEEHFIIPELINRKLLTKFDILYSEFHTGKLNNPVENKSIYIYKEFLNYTKSFGIESYEEGRITYYQIQHYLDVYKELVSCRKGVFM